jgi:DNA-binding IscR family transcriptional regulator
MSTDERRPSWTFLTNHTQVLLCIAQNSSKVTLRDVAQLVGITERAVQRIVADLAAAGILERRRIGRRNHYLINRNATMRHAAQAEHRVGPLLDLLRPKDERDTG